MTLIPPNILKEAIDAGYDWIPTCHYEAILDPKFWQSLAKARKWPKSLWNAIDTASPHWEMEIHNLVELLFRPATMQEIDQFWKKLP